MRRYKITDGSQNTTVVSLLRLAEVTDFSPNEFDTVADLSVGAQLHLPGGITIERVS